MPSLNVIYQEHFAAHRLIRWVTVTAANTSCSIRATGDSPLSITSVPVEEIVPWTVFCRGLIWYTDIVGGRQLSSSPLHADQ
jgi:hypothetical protein